VNNRVEPNLFGSRIDVDVAVVKGVVCRTWWCGMFNSSASQNTNWPLSFSNGGDTDVDVDDRYMPRMMMEAAAIDDRPLFRRSLLLATGDDDDDDDDDDGLFQPLRQRRSLRMRGYILIFSTILMVCILFIYYNLANYLTNH